MSKWGLIGLHKCSLAYTSPGERRYNQPFHGTSYGPAYVQGDVIGVGYRPRSGTIFFTRNGRKLDDVVHGLRAQNFFPTVGANGPCHIHVNFGQLGFVFIEANVKKWGLAPMTGSLAPPPPYGSEQGSILLEGGRDRDFSAPTSSYVPAFFHPGHGRSISAQVRLDTARQPLSAGPRRSPTDISLAALSPSDAREDIGAVIDEEVNANSVSHASFASATNPRDINAIAPFLSQQLDYQPDNNLNQASAQTANAAAMLGQPTMTLRSALAAINQQAEQSAQQRQQQGYGQEGQEGQERLNESREDEPPPPDYESPQHTPTTGASQDAEREESASPLPATQQEGQQVEQVPPIPSYDAAVSGGESSHT